MVKNPNGLLGHLLLAATFVRRNMDFGPYPVAIDAIFKKAIDKTPPAADSTDVRDQMEPRFP